MEAATEMGMTEICLTAKHAGGFTLWPSNYTPYGVHASMSFQGGNGDVVKAFVSSAKKYGIRVETRFFRKIQKCTFKGVPQSGFPTRQLFVDNFLSFF